MKSPNMLRIATVALAMSALLTSLDSLAADAKSIEKEFTRLETSGSEDPQAWFALARTARDNNELEVASKSLDRASGYGLSPVQAGIEKARILLAGDDPGGATAALRAVFTAGFTGVGVLQNDPLINSMAGREDYDALIDEMTVQAFPCEHQDGFRDFDFWIGEWDVHLANGTYAGSNVIKPIERGCALTEHWTSANGGTGMSINYLDKASGDWVQVWNAAAGAQIIIRGGLTDDGMALEGYIHYVANETTAPFRGLWTPLPDGRVRQYFEQSNDDGKTWNPWFEGFYSRKQ
ncbi:MAG: hypothetical protein R3192_04830 [Woeseiaceae bacterium]|nr:hypothetical protein [Woeseiaceae bacterium]